MYDTDRHENKEHFHSNWRYFFNTQDLASVFFVFPKALISLRFNIGLLQRSGFFSLENMQ